MSALVIWILGFAATALEAAPARASIEQQAEIITYIEQARYAVDDSGGHECKEARNLSYCRATKSKFELEEAMGILHDKYGNPLRVPTEEDLKKISGGWFSRGNKRQEYAEATRICQEARDRADENYKQAMIRTIRAYNISPGALGGVFTLINGQPWLIERIKTITWLPKVSRMPELKSPPGSYPPEYETGEDFEDQPGFVREKDGAIILRETAFFDHGRPDPGRLASILRHEELHLRDFIDPDKDLRNEPVVEMGHRVDVLFGKAGGEDVYELSAHEWMQELKNIAWQNDLRQLWNKAIEEGKNPYNEGDYKLIFKQLHITKERKEEIDRQVEHDSGVFEEAEKLGPGPEALEHVRRRGESDFLKLLGDGALRSAMDNWKRARELYAGRTRKERELLYAMGALEIERCGFELPPYYAYYRMERDERWFDEFYHPNAGGGFKFNKAALPDLEGLKAGLLLARACVAANRHGGMTAEVCNDGLGIINRRWPEPRFREMLRWTGSDHAKCVALLVDELKVPMDAARLWDAAKSSAEKARRAGGGESGSSRPPGSDGRDRGSDGSSGRGGDGVGDGDGPTRRIGEDIDRTGKWPN